MRSRPSYEPRDLVPQATGPFTPGRARRAKQHQKWDPTAVPLPAAFDVKALMIPTAVAAIRKAFTLSKTSHDSWRSAKREGKLDFRAAPRAARGAQDIFKRKTGTSTTRVKCSVLIDASGSMMGSSGSKLQHPTSLTADPVNVSGAMAAAVFGATIAEALGRVPTVDIDVFRHSADHGELYLKWQWSKGTPVAVFNSAIYGLGGGRNADGHALFAITERMKKEITRGERGVILMVSDGLPSAYARDGQSRAGQALIDGVAHARKAGIEVIAVAIDGSDQSVYYGKDGFIPFTGNWTALGSALARKLGGALARR